MPSVLITGANRGIGLEFARQYAGEGWQVHATARDLTCAEALAGLDGDITLYELDVRDVEAIKALADEIDVPLDIVIANAGVSGRTSLAEKPGQLGALEFDNWRQVLDVNLIGAAATCEAFAPHVEKAGGKMVAISSQLGSNANSFFGSYAYNISKAALNMAMNLIAIELAPRGVAVGTLHPGWVQTDMGGEQAPVTPAQSVSGLRKVISGLIVSEKAHFLDYQGEALPW